MDFIRIVSRPPIRGANGTLFRGDSSVCQDIPRAGEAPL